MDIISRKEWGARNARATSTTSWSRRTEFVVHHSEGPITQSVRSIQDFHMDGRGWADIGYNFLVDYKGRIYEGRGWLVIGAHATGHNTSGIGVCVIGRDGTDITDAAKRSVRWLYDQACAKAGRTLAKRGHGDLMSTDCPGRVLRTWVHAGMPATGGSTPAVTEGDDPLIGLEKGDTGQPVKALQELIRYAGQGEALGKTDGDYGPKTAEALRLVRKSVGSNAGPGFGDKVDGWAYAQLMAAVARKQGKE